MPSGSQQRAARAELRAKRRAISLRAQQVHALRAALRAATMPDVRRARHIALYVAYDAELDPTPLRARLEGKSRRWYLPVICSMKPPTLKFRADSNPLRRRNRFGILEPQPRAPTIKGSSLDLIVVPLVGFDSHCQRIGMGLGFYDRYLAQFEHRSNWKQRPLIVGFAHEIQHLDNLPANDWDIPLDAVVTEARLYRCKSNG